MAKPINETHDHLSQSKIINLPAPSSANDAARKADVDAVQSSLKFMETPVVAVADANVNVASPGATIDGVAPTSGDLIKGRVLLTAQTTPSENGTYIWNGAASAMTRTTDTYENGTVIFADNQGSTYKNTGWIQTTADPVVGSTSITFTQLPLQNISAGTGLTKTGLTIALTVPVSLANGGTAATSASAARTSLGVPGIYEADFGDGSSSSFTINHALGRQGCAVVVFNKSTNQDEDCLITRTDANNLVLSAEAWTAAPPALNAYHVVCIG